MLSTNLKIDPEEDKEIDLEDKEVKEEMITVDSTTTTLEIWTIEEKGQTIGEDRTTEEIIEIEILIEMIEEITIDKAEEIGTSIETMIEIMIGDLIIETMIERIKEIEIEKIEEKEDNTDLEESLLRRDKIEEPESLSNLPSWQKLCLLMTISTSLSR